MDSDWSSGCLVRDGSDSPAWVFGSCGGRVGSGMVEDVGGLSDLPLIGSSDVYMDNWDLRVFSNIVAYSDSFCCWLLFSLSISFFPLKKILLPPLSSFMYP